MAIVEIAPKHLKSIAEDGIARNYTPTLEKQIEKNLGVASVDHTTSAPLQHLSRPNVKAFALYTTKHSKYIKIFEIDGREDGIKEIINYFIGRMQWNGRKRGNLFIEVPINRTDILNILKGIKVNNIQIFSFSSDNNNIIATYPPQKDGPSSFKKFLSSDQPTNSNSEDDEYGLFKDMPWKDK